LLLTLHFFEIFDKLLQIQHSLSGAVANVFVIWTLLTAITIGIKSFLLLDIYIKEACFLLKFSLRNTLIAEWLIVLNNGALIVLRILVSSCIYQKVPFSGS
jgi:hypothetical protein